ncbi:MAG: SPOR domain-containing protein [Alphaproteobacteria bacterium]
MAKDEPEAMDEPQEIYHPERVRPGQRRLIAAVLGVAALAGFAAIVWYAYSEGKRIGAEGIAPLIVADSGPVKVRPEKPGGMAIPDRDKAVYSRIAPEEAKGKVERLLPPPEVPLPRRIVPAPPPPAPAPEQQAASTQAGTAAPPAPPKAALPRAEAPKAAAKAAPVKPAPSTVKSGAKGKFLVQLASMRTPGAARTAWGRMKRDHAALLGKLDLDVARADLGAKGVWYRVRAGGLADAAAAKRLCDGLKARKQPCLIVRP